MSKDLVEDKGIQLTGKNGFSMVWTGDFTKLANLGVNLSKAVDLSLTKVGLIISNSAKENAPVRRRDQYPDTPSNQKRKGGTLRKSITLDFSKIKQGFVVVGSKEKYARVREYVNNLNPTTKYYLRNAKDQNMNQISDIINKYLSENIG